MNIYLISSGFAESELPTSALLTNAAGGLVQPLTQMVYSTSTYAYPLPSKSSPIHYSLITVSFFATYMSILSVSQCRKISNK